MFWRYLLVFCLSIFPIVGPAYGAKDLASAPRLLVRYPLPTGDEVYRNQVEYFRAMLDLALEMSGRDYQLKAYPLPTTTASRNQHYIAGGIYDVAWIHTDANLEKSLRPVRIPLLKGLIGWRLFFIRSEDAAEFAEIGSLSDLQTKFAGQGYDYPDNGVLEAARLKVRTGLHRNTVLQMLLKHRVDYFPRSVAEIFSEWQELAVPGLAIEQTLALHYPSAFYFFVASNNTDLADTLTAGLKLARDSGRFDELFARYFGEALRRANLGGRKIITLSNPAMEATLPLAESQYWLQL